MGKKFVFLIITFLSFLSVFSATNSYQEYTSQIPWSYEIYETTDNFLFRIKKSKSIFL